ncbi:hypothetical protein [Polluticaenibacter yanchengensis]|uniref:Uncharacterized protein n=1 Tax=Polluticaenibacter yanchengensis TaxID=3014562 RepID=A0ABT4UG26_9BACT|nr:hypothetical protein [Chitinophagaceae bacterium LY-5]
MGIFDFFKKKDKNINAEKNENLQVSSQTNEARIQASLGEISVEVVSDNKGSHGDNFGGLLGFSYLNSDKGNRFINEMIALASIEDPILKNPVVKIHEAGFDNSDSVRIRTIAKNGNISNGAILSAYPYIKTNYILPFETKRIIEWSHIGNMEAEIQGGGRNTFGLSFFATDYAINKSKYKAEKNLNIRISAIGLVLDKNDLTEINGTAVSPEFSTYMPSKDISRPTYFDFIGVLNNYTECKINDENYGYMINVKLINQEDDPDFFTVDMFVNKENMRFDNLKQGMKVAGLFWLQGEIA